MGVVIASLAAVAGALWVQWQGREVQRLASPLTACPEKIIEVVSSLHTDTSETHVVRGCGAHVTIVRAAPDSRCFAEDHAIIAIPANRLRAP
jgi:hypothetical protein